MSITEKDRSEQLQFETVPAVAISLFRMSWQFELWLREIVSVELRASQLDWKARISDHVHNWPPRA